MKEDRETIVIIRSNPVNPDSRVEKEANSLIKEGFSVRILAWDRDENYESRSTELSLINGSIKITRFGIKASFGEGFKNLRAFMCFQIRMAKWLITNRGKYKIIHACDFDTAFLSSIISKILQKKIVFDIFDYLSTNPNNIFKRIVKIMENSIINRADAVIICTEKRIHQIEGTSPKRLAVIHNSPEDITTRLITEGDKRKLEERIKIVYVGILQDYRLLIEMCESISEMENYELHIGGFGKYEDKIKKMASMHNNIKFYGKLTYDETLKLESECDIMTAIYDPTIGNHYYAAPNKFYEALMLGKPLIMVKNTGMSEIVEINDVGILIEYSKESIKKALDELVMKKNEWDKMGEKMKQIYLQNYSWKEMENRLIHLYDGILNER